jgi:hypothetical protein
MNRLTLFLIFVFSCHCAIGQPIPNGYRLYKKFPLTDTSVNGTGGSVQLLVDSRLSDAVLTQEEDKIDILQNLRPQKGILWLISDKGGLLSKRDLEKPIVDLAPFPQRLGENPVFLLTEDWSAGFGSYSGPITTLVCIENGRIEDVTALNSRTKKASKIVLMKSLKTKWKIDLKNKSPQILEVKCRPDTRTSLENLKFLVTYSRYRFDANGWTFKEHQVSGFWEDEGDFPKESLFP